MALVKDLLKTMIDINSDTNLRPIEKVTLYCLVQHYNIECCYAYPTYDELKAAMSTNRNSTVSDTLKSLAEKGYIKIDKCGRNKNTYHLLKYIYIINTDDYKKQNVPVIQSTVAPVEDVKSVATDPVNDNSSLDAIRARAEIADHVVVDSNGKKPLEGQVHVADLGIDVTTVNDVCANTGFTKEQATVLLRASENRINLVMDAYSYTMGESGVDNTYKYCLKMVNVFKNKQGRSFGYNGNTISGSNLKFNNFEPREYDYEKLERQLLGWDDSDEIDICGCTNGKGVV